MTAPDPGGPGRSPRRRRRWLRWLLIATPVLAVAAFALKRRAGGGDSAALEKSLTATVKRGDLEITVLETGRVEARAQSQVKSRVGGQVTEVTVEEGQQVKVGQVLVRLEQTDHRREVARMEAEVRQMQLAVQHAERELDRTRRARANNIAPAMELDQAENQAALARARLDAGKVALATARDRLRYTEIEAPIAGTVIQRNINPGESVVPGAVSTFDGKALMVIADLGTLIVKIDLNQIDVVKVRAGMEATVTLDALPGKTYEATITKVAPASTGTGARGGSQSTAIDSFPVEATLAAGQDLSEIKPGMTADVRVRVEKKAKVLLLPIEAVISEKGKQKVLLLTAVEGKPRSDERDVTTGARNDREVEISAGLSEGAKVVIRPPAPEERRR